MSSMEQANDGVVDLAVIGGGPTGLFGAFYAGLRGLSVKIIDSLELLGGQLVTLYPEKYIYDVAGFPKILAKDLAQQLIEQVRRYDPAVCLGERVMNVTHNAAEKVFSLQTQLSVHKARSILVAAGVGAFEPKTLGLNEAAGYQGRGLYYFVKELAALRQKRVLIVGGGDSAVDWANTVAPIASSVTLIHRRDQFRAHEQSVAQMRRQPINILTFHELRRIEGREKIERATIYDNRTNDEQTLEIDALLVNVGFHNSLGPIKDWGLEIEGGAIKVDSTMMTSQPGIFAAGDIATFPGKLKLIATGFGEACVAVNYAKHYLDPAAHVFPGHSSNMKM
jgi:ferredoxin/flavodoxin---NADP+ reductase